MPDEVCGLGDLLTEAGDLRTLPCHMPGEGRGGLDGFFAARWRREA
jgi:16S rRNA (cytosine967-C5)-methyltransferase